MDEQDALELQRRRLLEDIRESVEKQLIRRYSWIGVVVAAVAGLLVTLTVRDLLSDARVQLAAARQVQEDTTKRLLDATQASTELSATTEASIKKFEAVKTSVERRLQEVISQATSLRTSLAKESTSTLKISADLNTELKRLSKAVGELGARQTASASERKELETQLAAINQSLGQSSIEIEAASQAAELSAYSVRVLNRSKRFLGANKGA